MPRSDAKPPLLTHAERRERRRVIATSIATGMAFEDVLSLYGVTRMTVWTACRENGVDCPRLKQTCILRTLALLINTDLPPKVVASRCGVSVQRVSEVGRFARAAGIRFPLREKSGQEIG